MREMKKPVIAIPIGDPAGVGPEIVAKSIASDEVFPTLHWPRYEVFLVYDKTP